MAEQMTKDFITCNSTSIPYKVFKFWGITFVERTAYEHTKPPSLKALVDLQQTGYQIIERTSVRAYELEISNFGA